MSNLESRKKKLKKNTMFSLCCQATNILCSFLLPRLMLVAYGSELNGLVNSITQFLHIVGFLELGVGSVVQSALYKPLAEKDTEQVSKVIASAQRYFRRIAKILLVYVLILVAGYPYISDQTFGWGYTALLILSISISSFAQYYFGIVDTLLLNADQRGYVQYIAQIVTILLNTGFCVVLISCGVGIHVVKLVTSVLYLLRPLALRCYISRHYRIDRNILYEEEPIAQKWNGIAQHIAAVVLDGTDAIILTWFSSLSNVSIYSVYHMVIAGVKGLFLSLTHGVKALLGELWAKRELEALRRTFGWFEWVVHTGTVFVFGCTAALIVPFVLVYTQGITDAQYNQPLFAGLLTLAHGVHCLRLPYNVMILAGGHYKQTQSNYIIAAVMNVGLSIAFVIPFGLIGVAIGTLAAMAYQTVWMAWYVSGHLVKWPLRCFLKQLAVDLCSVTVFAIMVSRMAWDVTGYFQWVVLALQTVFAMMVAILLVNTVFYRQNMVNLLKKRKRT